MAGSDLEGVLYVVLLIVLLLVASCSGFLKSFFAEAEAAAARAGKMAAAARAGEIVYVESGGGRGYANARSR